MKCCSAINSASLFGKDLELYFSSLIVSIAVMKRYVVDVGNVTLSEYG